MTGHRFWDSIANHCEDAERPSIGRERIRDRFRLLVCGVAEADLAGRRAHSVTPCASLDRLFMMPCDQTGILVNRIFRESREQDLFTCKPCFA